MNIEKQLMKILILYHGGMINW